MSFWKFWDRPLSHDLGAEELKAACEIRADSAPTTPTDYWCIYINEPQENSIELPTGYRADLEQRCEAKINRAGYQLSDLSEEFLAFAWLLGEPDLITAIEDLLAAQGPQCDNTSVGYTPLTDLGTAEYERDGEGEEGGLYGEGSNTCPSAHQAAGVALGAQVEKLDTNGDPDAGGTIVLLGLGMSQQNIYMPEFITQAAADGDVSTDVTIVNGSVSSFTYDRIGANINNIYWTTHVPAALSAAGVGAEQVQVVFMLNAWLPSEGSFTEYRDNSYDAIVSTLQFCYQLYPNLKQVWLGNRCYAGYAGAGVPSPEPYAYECGFSVRKVILSQIAGDADLVFDEGGGTIVAPWCAWGVDIWADGENTRSDGLEYECADMRVDDGMHAGDGARDKVVALMLSHFKTNTATSGWFLA